MLPTPVPDSATLTPQRDLRVNLQMLGCRLNEAELEGWARDFQAAGWHLVGDGESADLVVFNSCAVTQDAVRKSRNLLRRAARQNPGAKLVVSGCYVSLDPEEAAGLGIDLIVPNRDKARLAEIALRAFGFGHAPAESEPATSPLLQLGRHRAFVKVQDGCRHRCTYCIVTLARGAERSRSPTAIIAEIDRHHRHGLQEAVLTGVHLGGYGSDLGLSLSQLIRQILAETRIPRLRLGSLEPWDLPEDFPSLFDQPRLMPHLHLPLQSGSDSVLKRMARRCRVADFHRLVQRLRAGVPGIRISTDIIVGFPGETETEWQESLETIAAIGFSDVHVFSYSPRAGTAAAAMPNQVRAEIKRERSRTLQQLAHRLRRESLAASVGQEQLVLWEGERRGPDGDGVVFGYTPNYLKVARRISPREDLAFHITPARLLRVDPTGDFLWTESP